LFRAYRGRILTTYALFNLENLARLAQPWVLGWAISDLLQNCWWGLIAFCVHHWLSLGLSLIRRRYDTRAFTRIYSDLASRTVLDQKQRGAKVSHVAARSVLSRQIVDFFERHVPFVLQAFYSLGGALVMLAIYDWFLVPCCLLFLIPAGLASMRYGRKTLRLNQQLHDQLEREVDVIGRGMFADIRAHYEELSRRRIELSDAEATILGLLESLTLVLFAGALIRACVVLDAGAGTITAVFAYLSMFCLSVLNIPVLVEHCARLRDVIRRIGQGA
jgi:ABC-type multidrug transport system fused ATPase/permease subunit